MVVSVEQHRNALHYGMFLLVLLSGMWFFNAAAEIRLLIPSDNAITPDIRPSNDPLISHSDDLSIPHPIICSWSTMEVPVAAGYTLYLSKDSVIDSTDIYLSGIADTLCEVWNLEIGRRYFWTVSETGTPPESGGTAPQSFTTDNNWPRMLYIDGTTNVRDIGGWTTMDGALIQQGLLYRSAEFNQTQNITEKGLQQLEQLGIVTEIDLKMNHENPQNVIPWLPNYIRPLSVAGDGMSLYLEGLTQTPEVVAAVFRALTNPQNYPVIIHCRMGADRTAEIVAMLEAILGCSYEQIVVDYTWSSLSTMGRRDSTFVYWNDFVSYVRGFDTDSGTIQKGSWNLLQTIGLSVQELIAIRKIFIHDDRIPYTSIVAKPRSAVRTVVGPRNQNMVLLVKQGHGFHDRSGSQGALFDLSGRQLLKMAGCGQWSRYPYQAQGYIIVAVKNRNGVDSR